MKKRFLSLALVFAMLVTMIPIFGISATAETTTSEIENVSTSAPNITPSTSYNVPEGNIIASGICEYSKATWTFSDTGELHISGNDSIPSYSTAGSAPWTEYNALITAIRVDDTITDIGSGAFRYCTNVVQLSLPYVGQRFAATGYESVFGYIFGYEQAEGHVYYSNSSLLRPLYSTSTAYINTRYGTQPTGTTWQWSNFKRYTVGNGGYDYYYTSYYYYIPTTIRTVTITGANAIPIAAFNQCSFIESFNMNYGINSIGDYAFQNCAKLLNIDLSYRITSIGEGSFRDCSSLSGIVIPEGVTKINRYAFYGASSLKHVSMSNKTTDISEYAFYGCTSLLELNLPDTVTSIGSYAFHDCSSLTKLDLRGQLEEIHDEVFSGCSNVKELVLGENLIAIGGRAFKDLSKLTELTVPNNVKKIDVEAFAGCNALINVTLPFVGASRTSTGRNGLFGYLFSSRRVTVSGSKPTSLSTTEYINTQYGTQPTDTTWQYSCYSSSSSYNYYYTSYYYYVPTTIRTVTITDATAIPVAAFNHCSFIKTINLNDGITSVGNYAFQNSGWLNAQTGDFAITNNGFLVKYSGVATEVVVPNGVRYIGDSVFYNNTNITCITLPEGLKGIGNNAFAGTSNVTSIEIPRTVDSIASNALTDKAITGYYNTPTGGGTKTNLDASFTTGETTFYYTVTGNEAEITGCNTTATAITVPTELDGVPVTKIGDYGFYNCKSLTSITITSSIRIIGAHAFDNCTGLVNATIPPTVDSVGDYAFRGCTALENVTISEGVESLGEGIFYGCSALKEAVVPDTNIHLGAYAFYGCTAMTTAIIGINTDSVEEYTFYNCTSLAEIVIGMSVGEIGDYAFCNTAVSRVTLPNTVTRIGKNAFKNCAALEQAILCDGIGAIDYGAFYNCSMLSGITLPATLSALGDYAFYKCSSLPTASLSTGISHIGVGTFYGCSSLETLTVSSALNAIHKNALNGAAISSFEIPAAVTMIDSFAFNSCPNLTVVSFPNNVTKIGAQAFAECTTLANISLADSVPEVGFAVFYHNNHLSASIRKHTGRIANSLLYGQQVETVTMENGIVSIGQNAFAYNPVLKTVIFSKDIQSIGDYAFRSCSGITEIYFPDSVTTLGDCVFYACIALEQAEFGTKIVTLGDRLFYACVNLKRLVLNGDVNYIHDYAFYGAEDVTVYAFSNEYVRAYCNDNALTYVDLLGDFTMTLTPPDKTAYLEYEALDLTGLSLEIRYSNGTVRNIGTGYTVTEFDSSKLGEQKLTVTYNEQTTDFTVVVSARDIRVIHVAPPTKSVYALNEPLLLSGMEVTVEFVDGLRIVLPSGYTVSELDSTTTGEKTITVNYRGYTDTFKVSVEDSTTVVIALGDPTGDGEINIFDIMSIRNHIFGTTTLAGNYFTAADITGDGELNIFDIMAVRNHILGTALIS